MTDEFERKSHTTLKTSYLLVTGELSRGFTFYGPFNTPADAGKWAAGNLKKDVFYLLHDLQNVRIEK